LQQITDSKATQTSLFNSVRVIKRIPQALVGVSQTHCDCLPGRLNARSKTCEPITQARKKTEAFHRLVPLHVSTEIYFQ